MIRLAALSLLAAPILLAPPAHADPVTNYAASQAYNICQYLDSRTTLTGLTSVFEGVQRDTGFSDRDTVTVVMYAIDGYCPRHYALVQRFVETYRGSSGVSA